MFRVVLLAVCLIFWLPAQSTDAVLSGTVADSTGAVIGGVAVVAENTATGVRARAVSNQSGVYTFPALQPGVYQVTAEHAGFRKLVYTGVALEVGARLQVNLTLQLGDVAESVEVTAESDNLLGYATASVGGVVSGQKVQDLPLPARNALSLVYTQAGLVGDNLAGARIASINITVDGINVQDQRNNNGVSSPIFMSVDRIEEFRILTAPADAEFGRGSGQVQMITRSGTNQIHGSVFEFHRNTVLNANTWFNNQRGTNPQTGEPVSPRNNLIRNQFGGRIGGPIRRNQTFFHVLYDAQRIRQRSAVTSTVYTAPARQGTFRFYTGVRNGNAESASPTVDLSGNPRQPANGAALQEISLFNRDPNRSRMDPTGLVPKLFDVMPLPNNYRVGDGLNTAGYTWQRSSSDDLNSMAIKIDHSFTAAHRATYSYNPEWESEYNTRYQQPFPSSPGGTIRRRDRLHTLSVLSTLRSNVLNEFRAGVLRPDMRGSAPWELEEHSGFLPRANGQPYIPVFNLVTDVVVSDDDPVRLFSPMYQFTDNLSWMRGKHAFKGGFEVRFASTNSFNSADVMPRANFGTGAVPVVNIDRIAGIGQNVGNATSMLNDLSGSLASVLQALNAVGGTDPQYQPGLYKYRHWKRPEISWFFKDDWKVTPNLTLNLGLRWEYYGVPYDPNGRTTGLVNGTAGIFGISGTTFADVYQPGRTNGSLSQVSLIGPGTANPDQKLYNEDYNNFAPAVGLSYALPWLKRKTILRAGYGVFYERNSLRLVDVVSGDQPGLLERVLFQSSSYLDLSGVRLPLEPRGVPLTPIPITDRTQIIRTFDTNLRTPYIQNWNLSIQREIARNTILDVRYVGSKGTKLIRGADINERNIFENGILEAFQITQAGGHAPLLDPIFTGLTISGLGRVDGARITGSDAMRANNTTQAYLAGNNVGAFAEYLNTSTQFTGIRGGLLRRAGLPENFVIANPQVSSARLNGNFANSTYHSLQVELIKRFSAGWTFQGNYTWSRSLGEEDGDGDSLNLSYRSGRDRSLDKGLLGFHRTHVIRTSGTYEFPFGPGKRFLGGSKGVLARLLERWQVGSIINVFSGDPISIFSGRSSFNSFNAASTPATAVGDLDKGLGSVQRVGNGVVYFSGLRQVPDPGVQNLTTANNIRGRSTMQGLADESGNLLMVNPVPGSPGTMGLGFFQGPGALRFDVNLVKRIKLTEAISFELRADAISALNTPNFNNPNGDMNSVNFGRITSTSDGNRILVVGGRINF
jgi:hypothetical protein